MFHSNPVRTIQHNAQHTLWKQIETLDKNTSLSGKAGDVLETLTNITSKDQLAHMCQGCLSFESLVHN